MDARGAYIVTYGYRPTYIFVGAYGLGAIRRFEDQGSLLGSIVTFQDLGGGF